MNLEPTLIRLPVNKKSDWKIFIVKELKKKKNCEISLDCGIHSLTARDIIYLSTLCKSFGHKLNNIKSNIPETVVCAKSLSINSELYLETTNKDYLNKFKSIENDKGVIFHKGTIRAGDRIQSEGDLLVLGDVNPGAIVSANGDVMIWGKLSGIAHAGKAGNREAKISALSLRPVQLRIADIVAKGPKELQIAGLAEQAVINHGLIVINPLCT